MRHLLALCIAILCMSMASVPDTQKPRREEAIALIQSTKGINVCGKQSSITDPYKLKKELEAKGCRVFIENSSIHVEYLQ